MRIDYERAAKTEPNFVAQHAHARAPVLAPTAPLERRCLIKRSGQKAYCWFQDNTLAPSWLPASWRRPLVGYLMAVLLEVLAVSITLLLSDKLPIFALQGSLVILGIILVALNWGAGPGVLASVVGIALLDWLVLPQAYDMPMDQFSTIMCRVMFGLIGLSISLIASQSGRARQRAEKMAAQREAVFESIADGVIVTDPQGRILHMNPAIRTLLGVEHCPHGLTMPELERMYGFAAFNTQDQPLTCTERPINRYLQGETLTRQQSVDLIVRTRDGREVRLNNSGAPIRDRAGHLLGAVEIIRDVTEQRQWEHHTRDALHALLEMAEILVQVQQAPKRDDEQRLQPGADPTLHMVARRLVELTRRVLGCQHISMVAIEPETGALQPITIVGFPPAQEAQWWHGWTQEPPRRFGERVSAALLDMVRSGEPVRLERTHPAIRSWQQLSSAATLLFVPMLMGEALIGLLVVDYGAGEQHPDCPNKIALAKAAARLGALVLERERLLRERAQAQANELALRETNQQMDTFLGIAGHELKNPLAVLKLSTQLSKRRLQSLGKRGAEAAQEIKPVLDPLASTEEQLGRLERLVNDVLDVSRIQAGRLELRPDDADLVQIVRQAVEEQRQVAPGRLLLLHLPRNARALVYADAERIGQVVTNYLTNALKYSSEDRPVFVGLDVEERQVRVWVRDEGPGVPPEEQDHIWERFHRARGIEVQSGTGVGLGLGLHICRTIIESQQGQVGVRSMPGAGSTFWFTLPLSSEDEERVDGALPALRAM